MQKVDPFLWTLLEQRERAHAAARGGDERAAAELLHAPIDVVVEFTGGIEALRAAGFPLHDNFPGSARGGLSAVQIRELIALPQVRSVEIPHPDLLLLDRSVPEIRANVAWAFIAAVSDLPRSKGAGVIVGIVDTGIDVYHGAFRKPDGKTRILRLWDQTFQYNAAGVPADSMGMPLTGDLVPRDEAGAVLTPASAPTELDAAFRNGAEFTCEQINDALTAHPDGENLPRSLRDEPVRQGENAVYHGTHVAGIAAGNGAQKDRCTDPLTYVGVAPEADIVFVKTGVSDQPNTLHDLLLAVRYIFKVAALPPGKPCVVNLSVGGHGQPHNGHSGLAHALEALTAPPLDVGRAIVFGAGNDRDLDLHAAFVVPQNMKQTVRVQLTALEEKRFALFGSFNSAANLTCIVREPLSGDVVQSDPFDVKSNNNAVDLGTRHKVRVRVHDELTGDPDRHFAVNITEKNGGNVESGTWEFDIAADAAASANVHLWVMTPLFKDAAIQPFPDAVPSVQDMGRPEDQRRPAEWIRATLLHHGTWPRAIAVAAYDMEDEGKLAYFSAQGPAPRNLNLGLYDPDSVIAKPDIAAPGMAIDAPRGEARKCFLECECCVDRYVADQGTSVAAPHVAGVIALMFALNPNLTLDEVKEKLRQSALNPPALPPDWPAPAELWGAGKIDAAVSDRRGDQPDGAGRR